MIEPSSFVALPIAVLLASSAAASPLSRAAASTRSSRLSAGRVSSSSKCDAHLITTTQPLTLSSAGNPLEQVRRPPEGAQVPPRPRNRVAAVRRERLAPKLGEVEPDRRCRGAGGRGLARGAERPKEAPEVEARPPLAAMW